MVRMGPRTLVAKDVLKLVMRELASGLREAQSERGCAESMRRGCTDGSYDTYNWVMSWNVCSRPI